MNTQNPQMYCLDHLFIGPLAGNKMTTLYDEAHKQLDMLCLERVDLIYAHKTAKGRILAYLECLYELPDTSYPGRYREIDSITGGF